MDFTLFTIGIVLVVLEGYLIKRLFMGPVADLEEFIALGHAASFVGVTATLLWAYIIITLTT